MTFNEFCKMVKPNLVKLIHTNPALAIQKALEKGQEFELQKQEYPTPPASKRDFSEPPVYRR